MTYTYELAATIGEVDQGDWCELCWGAEDLAMDPRFLAAAEASMLPPTRFWYLLIYDESKRPIAAAALCLFMVDAAILGQEWLKSAASRIRRLASRFFYLPILFCGVPVSSGQSYLRIAVGADVDRVLDQIITVLGQLAAEHRAWVMVFKEFSTDQVAAMQGLADRGFMRESSLPMNTFDPGYGSFEEFCGALRSHYRYKFRRSQRKFDRMGLQVQHLQGQQILEVYTDEVHRLYEAVVRRSENKLEILPAEFFRQLARRMPEEVRLMVVLHEQQIVGFSWGLLTTHCYQNMFIGIDYELNNRCDLYFNVMARSLDFALQSGVDQILVGQSADVFKSRLGCRSQPLFIFAKSNHVVVDWVMRRFARWFFPAAGAVQDRRLLRDERPSKEGGDAPRSRAGIRSAGREPTC